jgi:agmatine/peptidylarginine deiminase
MQDIVRFPAEWEPQAAILIAWPNAETDWAERLAEVEETYIALVAAITRFQRVVICVADDDIETYAEMRLRSNRVDMDRVRFATVPYDDTWLRDSGPITCAMATRSACSISASPAGAASTGQPTTTNWSSVCRHERTVRRCCARRIDFALEGGAIETDGDGTLLTTWQCLHERHPDASREELTTRLAGWLKQDRVLWLDHGYLEGDDTDAHIDTLARFAGPRCHRVPGLRRSGGFALRRPQAMGAEIAALRTREDRPYRLFPLPWAKPVIDIATDGSRRRLAASYANFLIVNGAVLMPAYGDPADNAAAAVLATRSPIERSCRSRAAR